MGVAYQINDAMNFNVSSKRSSSLSTEEMDRRIRSASSESLEETINKVVSEKLDEIFYTHTGSGLK